jgi:hypothetical protein
MHNPTLPPRSEEDPDDRDRRRPDLRRRRDDGQPARRSRPPHGARRRARADGNSWPGPDPTGDRADQRLAARGALMSANVSPVAWYAARVAPRRGSPGCCRATTPTSRRPAATLRCCSPSREQRARSTPTSTTGWRRPSASLRDRPVELQRALRLTPYARAEFEHCRDGWASLDGELERARRWYARTQMAFACSAVSGWGFEVDGAPSGATRAAGTRPLSRTCGGSPNGFAASRSTSWTGAPA